MPKVFWKNFHLCFATFKCLPPPPPPLPSPPPPPLPPDNNTSNPSPTSTLIRSFNTTVVSDLTSSDSKPFTDDTFSSSSDAGESDADTAVAPPPNLASVYASQRFFFSSPGRSNSIIDSSLCSTPQPETNPLPLPLGGAGGETVDKYSADPYADFYGSMKEMIEARETRLDVRSDWEYLHELLLCYLALNPKRTHKFIFNAFTDIVIFLMSQPAAASHRTVKLRNRRYHCFPLQAGSQT